MIIDFLSFRFIRNKMYFTEQKGKIFLCVNNLSPVQLGKIKIREVKSIMKKDKKFYQTNTELFVNSYHLSNFFDDVSLSEIFKIFKGERIELKILKSYGKINFIFRWRSDLKKFEK